MAWYRTGSVNVVNGSPAVVGVGTAWVSNARVGHGWVGPDKVLYEILSVNSDTSITLVENYGGATTAGGAYKLVPTQGEIKDLASSARTLVNDFGTVAANAGQGRFDGGSATTPGIASKTDLDTGVFWPAPNVWAVGTAGAERLRVDSVGRFGLGTSSLTGKLNVKDADGIKGFFEGDTYAVRLVTNSTDSRIEGVGATGLAGYQPLAVIGSKLTLGINGSQAVLVDPTKALIVSATATAPANARLASTVVTPMLQVLGTSVATSSALFARFNNDSSPPSIYLVKSRSTTVGGQAAVANLDTLGSLEFGGSDGTNPTWAARMLCTVDGTVDVDTVPARIVMTRPTPGMLVEVSGASGSAAPTPVEMRLSSTSNASDWSTTSPWGRLSFWSSDVSTNGPKNHIALDAVAGNTGNGQSSLVIKSADASGALAERARFDIQGNFVRILQSAVPTLTINGQAVWSLISDTQARLSVRGSDGVTRSANIALS